MCGGPEQRARGERGRMGKASESRVQGDELALTRQRGPGRHFE